MFHPFLEPNDDGGDLPCVEEAVELKSGHSETEGLDTLLFKQNLLF